MYTGGVSRVGSRLLVALCAAVLALTFTAGIGAGGAAEPGFSARGSVEQVYVTGATPGEQLSLVDSTGSTVSTRDVNFLGGALFRGVPPGSGYRVRASDGRSPIP
jgi:uncharacterized protein